MNALFLLHLLCTTPRERANIAREIRYKVCVAEKRKSQERIHEITASRSVTELFFAEVPTATRAVAGDKKVNNSRPTVIAIMHLNYK